MERSKDWWGGFCCGVAGALAVGVLVVLVVSFCRLQLSVSVALKHLSEGACGSIPARFFTCSIVLVSLLPFIIWGWRRAWFAVWFSFCRRLPTMIGMLGTLWSLLDSDLANPGSLAQKFSIAIVSTFLGLIFQIGLEGIGRLPYFTLALDEDAADGEA